MVSLAVLCGVATMATPGNLPRVKRHMPARGFTLIELLVVVSIIALLISILLPSLGRAKEMANRVYCSANMRGITQSMYAYSEDGNNTYPCVPGSGSWG